MRRFLLLTLIALLVCAGLSGAALWIGRQQPAARLLASLRFTDCAPPCWIGITPGKEDDFTVQELRPPYVAEEVRA